MTRGIVRVVGRRGCCLLFLALLDLIYGATLLRPPRNADPATLRFIGGIIPLWAWGLLWLTVGIICLLGAFRARDKWAYAAAMGLKVMWGGVFLLGWLLAGVDRGWAAAAIWLAFAAWLAVVSGWPEG